MEQILIRRPGGYGRLEIVSGPDPAPGPGEVLIETAAIGVNYADCIARMGLYASARELAVESPNAAAAPGKNRSEKRSTEPSRSVSMP